MSDLESLTKQIEENFKLLDEKKSAYQAKCTQLKKEIVDKVTLTADQIRKKTTEMYKIIHEQQLMLLDETDKYETELTQRLDLLCSQHQETADKIQKYDYIFNNVLLDEEKMNKMKSKVKELNNNLNANLVQLEKFCINSFMFKPTDLIEENLSIGDFYV
jgi:hypothetical protein